MIYSVDRNINISTLDHQTMKENQSEKSQNEKNNYQSSGKKITG